jgi:hypothetical protein
VLLGLNCATGAGLFTAQKILKFGDATVHLNNFGKEEDIEDINMLHADENDLLPINIEIFSNQFETINASTQLTDDEASKFQRLIQYDDNQNVFAYNYNDIEGYNLLPYVITTITDKPIFIPRYRRSAYENEIISYEINLMLQAKIK